MAFRNVLCKFTGVARQGVLRNSSRCYVSRQFRSVSPVKKADYEDGTNKCAVENLKRSLSQPNRHGISASPMGGAKSKFEIQNRHFSDLTDDKGHNIDYEEEIPEHIRSPRSSYKTRNRSVKQVEADEDDADRDYSKKHMMHKKRYRDEELEPEYDAVEQYELESAHPKIEKSDNVFDVFDYINNMQMSRTTRVFPHLQPNNIRPYGSTDNILFPSVIKPRDTIKYPGPTQTESPTNPRSMKVSSKDADDYPRREYSTFKTKSVRNLRMKENPGFIPEVKSTRLVQNEEYESKKKKVYKKTDNLKSCKDIIDKHKQLNPTYTTKDTMIPVGDSDEKQLIESAMRVAEKCRSELIKNKPENALSDLKLSQLMSTSKVYGLADSRSPERKKYSFHKNNPPPQNIGQNLNIKTPKRVKTGLPLNVLQTYALPDDPQLDSLKLDRNEILAVPWPSYSESVRQAKQSSLKIVYPSTQFPSNILQKENMPITVDVQKRGLSTEHVLPRPMEHSSASSRLRNILNDPDAFKNVTEKSSPINYSKNVHGSLQAHIINSPYHRNFNSTSKLLAKRLSKLLQNSNKKQRKNSKCKEQRECQNYFPKREEDEYCICPEDLKNIPFCDPPRICPEKVCPPRADENLQICRKQLPRLEVKLCPCVEPVVPTKLPNLRRLKFKVPDPPRVCPCPPCDDQLRADDCLKEKPKKLPAYVPQYCPCVEPPPLVHVPLKRLEKVKCDDPLRCGPKICPEKKCERADENLLVQRKCLPVLEPKLCPCVEPIAPSKNPLLRRLKFKMEDSPRICPCPPCESQLRADDCAPPKEKKLPKLSAGYCPCPLEPPMTDVPLVRLEPIPCTEPSRCEPVRICPEKKCIRADENLFVHRKSLPILKPKLCACVEPVIPHKNPSLPRLKFKIEDEPRICPCPPCETQIRADDCLKPKIKKLPKYVPGHCPCKEQAPMENVPLIRLKPIPCIEPPPCEPVRICPEKKCMRADENLNVRKKCLPKLESKPCPCIEPKLPDKSPHLRRLRFKFQDEPRVCPCPPCESQLRADDCVKPKEKKLSKLIPGFCPCPVEPDLTDIPLVRLKPIPCEDLPRCEPVRVCPEEKCVRADENLQVHRKTLPVIETKPCRCIEPLIPNQVPKLRRLKFKVKDEPRVCPCPPCESQLRADDCAKPKIKKLPKYQPGVCPCPESTPMTNIPLVRLKPIPCVEPPPCEPVRICPEKICVRADENLMVKPKCLPTLEAKPCPCVERPIPKKNPALRRLKFKAKDPPRVCPCPPCDSQLRADDCAKPKAKKLPKFVAGYCPCPEEPQPENVPLVRLKKRPCVDEVVRVCPEQLCDISKRADTARCFEPKKEKKSSKCDRGRRAKNKNMCYNTKRRYNTDSRLCCRKSLSIIDSCKSASNMHGLTKSFPNLSNTDKSKRLDISENENTNGVLLTDHDVNLRSALRKLSNLWKKNNSWVLTENDKEVPENFIANNLNKCMSISSLPSADFKQIEYRVRSKASMSLDRKSAQIGKPLRTSLLGGKYSGLCQVNASRNITTSCVLNASKTEDDECGKNLKSEKCRETHKIKKIKNSDACDKICKKFALPGCDCKARENCDRQPQKICCEKKPPPYPAFSECMDETIDPYYKTSQWTCDRKQYGFHPQTERFDEPIDAIRNKKKFSTLSYSVPVIQSTSENNSKWSSSCPLIHPMVHPETPAKKYISSSAIPISLSSVRYKCKKSNNYKSNCPKKPCPKTCVALEKLDNCPPRQRCECIRTHKELNCNKIQAPYPAFSECVDENAVVNLSECPDEVAKLDKLQPSQELLPTHHLLKAPPPHQGKIDPKIEEDCVRERLCMENEGLTQCCVEFGSRVKPLKAKHLIKEPNKDCEFLEQEKNKNKDRKNFTTYCNNKMVGSMNKRKYSSSAASNSCLNNAESKFSEVPNYQVIYNIRNEDPVKQQINYSIFFKENRHNDAINYGNVLNYYNYLNNIQNCDKDILYRICVNTKFDTSCHNKCYSTWCKPDNGSKIDARSRGFSTSTATVLLPEHSPKKLKTPRRCLIRNPFASKNPKLKTSYKNIYRRNKFPKRCEKFTLHNCPSRSRISCLRDFKRKPCKKRETPYPSFSQTNEQEMYETITECPLEAENIKVLQPQNPILPQIRVMQSEPLLEGKIDLLKEDRCVRDKLCLPNVGITQDCNDFGESVTPMKSKDYISVQKKGFDILDEHQIVDSEPCKDKDILNIMLDEPKKKAVCDTSKLEPILTASNPFKRDKPSGITTIKAKIFHRKACNSKSETCKVIDNSQRKCSTPKPKCNATRPKCYRGKPVEKKSGKKICLPKTAPDPCKPKSPNLWERIINYFKARPCPSPEELRMMRLREEAKQAAAKAGLCIYDPKLGCPRDFKETKELPKVITAECCKKQKGIEECPPEECPPEECEPPKVKSDSCDPCTNNKCCESNPARRNFSTFSRLYSKDNRWKGLEDINPEDDINVQSRRELAKKILTSVKQGLEILEENGYISPDDPQYYFYRRLGHLTEEDINELILSRSEFDTSTAEQNDIKSALTFSCKLVPSETDKSSQVHQTAKDVEDSKLVAAFEEFCDKIESLSQAEEYCSENTEEAKTKNLIKELDKLLDEDPSCPKKEN